MRKSQHGVYCSECREKHPAYHWHEKFDSYAAESIIRPRIERDVLRAFPNTSKQKLEMLYKKNRERKPYVEGVTRGKCFVCGEETFFKNRQTGHFICSEKCLYADVKDQKKEQKGRV